MHVFLKLKMTVLATKLSCLITGTQSLENPRLGHLGGTELVKLPALGFDCFDSGHDLLMVGLGPTISGGSA